MFDWIDLYFENAKIIAPEHFHDVIDEDKPDYLKYFTARLAAITIYCDMRSLSVPKSYLAATLFYFLFCDILSGSIFSV